MDTPYSAHICNIHPSLSHLFITEFLLITARHCAKKGVGINLFKIANQYAFSFYHMLTCDEDAGTEHLNNLCIFSHL